VIFRRLLELYSRSTAVRVSAGGLVVSLAAHLIMVGPLLVSPRASPAADSAEAFTPVEFLIPRDRLEGSRPKRETVSWVALAPTAALGFDQKKDESKDHSRLEIVMAKGVEADREKTETPPVQPPIALGDSIKTELEVDSTVVRYENSAAPPYPESMLRRRLEGSVMVQYVVDTTGRVDTASFRVLFATHADFAKSVKNTLPLMRFHPAMMANKHVAQLVEQPFVFKIVDTVRVVQTPKRPPEP
jgi:protein TonB